MTTDWNSILGDRKNVSLATQFAMGNLSGSEFYSHFAGTECGGEVRNLLRSKGGVNRARVLARKALNRRNRSATVNN
jgi:hypothetical protein